MTPNDKLALHLKSFYKKGICPRCGEPLNADISKNYISVLNKDIVLCNECGYDEIDYAYSSFRFLGYRSDFCQL